MTFGSTDERMRLAEAEPALRPLPLSRGTSAREPGAVPRGAPPKQTEIAEALHRANMAHDSLRATFGQLLDRLVPVRFEPGDFPNAEKRIEPAPPGSGLGREIAALTNQADDLNRDMRHLIDTLAI